MYKGNSISCGKDEEGEEQSRDIKRKGRKKKISREREENKERGEKRIGRRIKGSI